MTVWFYGITADLLSQEQCNNNSHWLHQAFPDEWKNFSKQVSSIRAWLQENKDSNIPASVFTLLLIPFQTILKSILTHWGSQQDPPRHWEPFINTAGLSMKAPLSYGEFQLIKTVRPPGPSLLSGVIQGQYGLISLQKLTNSFTTAFLLLWLYSFL